MTEEEKRAQELAAIQQRHGEEIAAFPSSFGWLVFRRPEQEVYEDFIEVATSDKGRKTAAMRSLCLRSALQPSREELAQIFSKQPALPTKICARLIELAGEDIQDAAKKG
jgi:hypothetical protein